MTKLTDLVDISLLQKLQDQLSAVTGLPIGIVDPKGNPITQISGNQRFCELILGSDAGFEACYRAVRDNLAKSPGAISEYKCEAELYHLATPILVEGNLLGNIVVGQLQREKLSKEKIEQLAEEYGISYEELLEASEDLTTYSKTKAEQVTRLLATISSAISTQASLKASIKQYSEQLEKKVEERTNELKESEEKHRSLFEHASDSIFIHDFEGRFLNVNQNACRRLGYTKEELLNMTIMDIEAPEFAENVPENIKKLKEQGEITIEAGHIRKDGSFMPVEITAGVIEYGGKKVIQSFARDITERKRAEEELHRLNEELEQRVEERTRELRESEEKLRNLIESTPIGISVSTPEGGFIEVNPAMLKMFGYDSKEEYLKLPVTALYYNPKDRDRFLELIKKGGVKNLEIQYKRKDGTVFWASETSIIQTTKTGMTQFINTVQDITERKRAGETLRNIVEGVSAEIGESFFTSLVSHLSNALQVDYAFVGELDEDNQSVTTIALSAKGKIAPNFEYNLEGTPCHNVVGKEICVYPTDVAQSFPSDKSLVEMDIESYIGCPLFSAKGQPLGLLVIMDSKPLEELELKKSLLKVFAVRAANELERKRAEEEMKRLKDFNEEMVEHSPVGIIKLDRNLKIIYENPKMKEILGVPKDKDSKAMGMDIRELPSVVRAGLSDAFNDLVQGKGVHGEVPFVSIYNRESTISFVGVPLFEDGRFAGALITVEDITERKRAEDELQRRVEELEEFHSITVGRELKMIELEKEIERLKEELKKAKGDG